MDTPTQKVVTSRLHQLQALDTEIETAQGALKQVTGQLGESRALLAARDELTAGKRRLEDLSREQQSLEWDIDEQTGKITALEDKLYGGKVVNSKELASLQQDVEAHKKQRRQMEDRVLVTMERREQATVAVASGSEYLADLEKIWQAEQEKLQRDAQALTAQLESLVYRRQEHRASLDGGIIELYEKIKAQKGNAVASVEQGICQGCRISLSQTQLQQVRMGSLVQCGNCGRVLYLA